MRATARPPPARPPPTRGDGRPAGGVRTKCGSFQGLHFLLSYATVSNDNTIEGDHFADYMTRTPFLWWNNPMKVRDAWVQTAIDAQPSSVTWAYMGPLGRNGLTDDNDFFWGKGTTGPDIRGADLTGWYQVQGPS